MRKRGRVHEREGDDGVRHDGKRGRVHEREMSGRSEERGGVCPRGEEER